MSSKLNENTQAVLKQLWGRNVPALTEEQIELSIKVWQKIKARTSPGTKASTENQTEAKKTYLC
jgi:hypothetical protein